MRNLLDYLPYSFKGIIGCYWPIKAELDTRPLISILLEKNIQIALPTIINDEMQFKKWKSEDKLYFSKYKFYSPSHKSKNLHPNIIITPALAVDSLGNRIGYGKGFYDKYYSKNKSKIYVGYVYKEQIFKALPFDKHDLKLNAIVTDTFVKKIKNSLQ